MPEQGEQSAHNPTTEQSNPNPYKNSESESMAEVSKSTILEQIAKSKSLDILRPYNQEPGQQPEDLFKRYRAEYNPKDPIASLDNLSQKIRSKATRHKVPVDVESKERNKNLLWQKMIGISPNDPVNLSNYLAVEHTKLIRMTELPHRADFPELNDYLTAIYSFMDQRHIEKVIGNNAIKLYLKELGLENHNFLLNSDGFSLRGVKAVFVTDAGKNSLYLPRLLTHELTHVLQVYIYSWRDVLSEVKEYQAYILGEFASNSYKNISSLQKTVDNLIGGIYNSVSDYYNDEQKVPYYTIGDPTKKIFEEPETEIISNGKNTIMAKMRNYFPRKNK